MKMTHLHTTLRAFVLIALIALPTVAARAADAPANAAAAPAAPDLNQIRSLLQMARYMEALPLAEAATKATPENAAAHLLHGRALAGLEQPKEAIAALGTATRLDPKSVEAFLALGDAHFLRYGIELREWLKKHQHAMVGQIHSEVLSARPGPGSTSSLIQETLINDRSSAQMNGKEWDQYTSIAKNALAAYNAALALDPSNRTATRGKGLAQLVLGDWKDTAAAFEAAGAPAFDSFVYELARNVYDARLMGNDAMRLWAAAERSDPTNAWAYWYQRDLYDEFKHNDWRYGYYDAMAKLYSDRLKDQKDARKYTPKDALKLLGAVTDEHADFGPAWRGRGIAAMTVKDTKQAKAAFEKAAALDESDWFSHLQLGVLLLNDKDATAAQSALAKAAKGNPESAVTWHALGSAAEVNKDLDGAVSYYERAAELAPAWPEAHYSLGALLLDRRQGAEARPHLQRYLELKPNASNASEIRTAIEQLDKILAAQG